MTKSSTGVYLTLESLSVIELGALKDFLLHGKVPYLGVLSKLCRLGLLSRDPSLGYHARAEVHSAMRAFGGPYG